MRSKEEYNKYLGPKLKANRAELTDFLVDEILVWRLAGKVTVTGKEHIPNKGAFVLGFSPHSGTLDGVSLRREMRRKLRPIDILTKIENETDLPEILQGPRMFFYQRYGEVDDEAMEHASSILTQGGIVCSAFEMGRGRGEIDNLMRLQRARKGLVLLAMQSKVPILPVATIGAEQIFPIPEQRIQEIGDNAFKLEVAREMLRFGKKPNLEVHFTEPYTDHLNDVHVQEERTFLRLVDTHAHLVMLTRIIQELPEGYPRGFYQNKTPEQYLEKLEKLRTQTA